MFNRKTIKQLRKKIEILEAMSRPQRSVREEMEKNGGLLKENAELKIENVDLTASLARAEAHIRKQTEADLYFECAEIMKELLGGGKQERLQREIEDRDRLYAQLQASRMGDPWMQLAYADKKRPPA